MKPTLIRHADAPRFELAGARVTGYASPSRGSRSLSAWRLTLPPGSVSPRHSLEVDEVFLALGGAAEIHAGGDVFPLQPGDAITVPAGTEFHIASVGAEPFEAVACVPAGMRARVEAGAPFVPPWAV